LPSGWLNASGYALNALGEVAGSGTNGGGLQQAFIGTASGSTAIPLPTGATTLPRPSVAINDAGFVVGTSDAGGWIWSAGDGTVLLNNFVPAGWVIQGAISISNNGLILAVGSFNSGASQYVVLAPSQCTVTLNPTSVNVTSAAQSSSFNVTTGTGCTWAATSNSSFVSITSGSSGTGNGTVNFNIAANSGSQPLAGTITVDGVVAGQTFTVNQSTGGPAPPTLVSPANGATGVSLTPALTWNASAGATSYDVYLGTSPTPPLVTNVTMTSYTSATLAAGTTYYWQIVAKNSGGTGGSSVWSFTTVPPGAPSTPVLTFPANGATGASLAPTLTWNASTGATSYSVYFGTSPTPPLVTSTTGTGYYTGPLVAGNTYYWQIVATNGTGPSASAIWSFTTIKIVPEGPIVPILDFNGDGNQDVLLYDPVNGGAYAALSNGTGGFNYVFDFFTAGFDTLHYGVLNAGGKSDLVAYNSTTTIGYALLGNGSGAFSSAVSVFWGPGFTKTAAGDLSGDGLTDFVIYRPTDGTMYTAISNGDGTFHYQYTLVSSGFTHLVVADFNGDGKADVLYYRSTDGFASLGIGNGTGGFTFSTVPLSSGYTFVEAGDINGDGMTDLLFYNGTSGAAAVGMSTGSSFTFTPYLYSPGFTTVKLFDFNGDGKADVAVYNMNTAIGYLGISNGTSAFTYNSLFWGPGFSIVNALDLNGDGKIDVVIYNTTNGAAYSGISSGNPANPFTYQYSYWGTGKVLANTAAQP
jgi:hypothetical protein